MNAFLDEGSIHSNIIFIGVLVNFGIKQDDNLF